jgi:hypothetical protein
MEDKIEIIKALLHYDHLMKSKLKNLITPEMTTIKKSWRFTDESKTIIKDCRVKNIAVRLDMLDVQKKITKGPVAVNFQKTVSRRSFNVSTEAIANSKKIPNRSTALFIRKYWEGLAALEIIPILHYKRSTALVGATKEKGQMQLVKPKRQFIGVSLSQASLDYLQSLPEDISLNGLVEDLLVVYLPTILTKFNSKEKITDFLQLAPQDMIKEIAKLPTFKPNEKQLL